MATKNKAQRSAQARKAADTRKRNAEAAAAQERMDNPNETSHEIKRTADQDLAEARSVEREQETDWSRPADLEAPPPRPGYTQRWVRVRIGQGEDSRNGMRKFREGWKPRKLETVPEGYLPPTFLHSRFGEVIGVEDLILCEMPLKMARQRNDFYETKTIRMIEGIENDLRKVSRGGPRMGFVERETKVTKRRNRAVQDPSEE